uniref:DUF1985 domain-containing protein n=1 Tax=Lactuca sativa TaxID=4236 RepID=A0A9R1X4S9_LACSA|nr:hypothetical protein LSAT_V11C700348350 [Lactuca sativa]
MVYGPKEFCLITGFNFRVYPKMIGKKVSEKKNSSQKRCLLQKRLFLNHTISSVKICDLRSYTLNQPLLATTDDNAVRVCLIYVLCEGFLEKEANDRVPQDWFFFVENLDEWNGFAWGSYLRDFAYESMMTFRIHGTRSIIFITIASLTFPVLCVRIYDVIKCIQICNGKYQMKWWSCYLPSRSSYSCTPPPPLCILYPIM